MEPGTVVLLGDVEVDRELLTPVAAQFGWQLHRLKTMSEQPQIAQRSVAVLFAYDRNWRGTLKSILSEAPVASPIVCHGSDNIPWPEIADAGAFHAIRLPLTDAEARQSFGFVWAALRQQSAGLFLVRRTQVASSGSAG